MLTTTRIHAHERGLHFRDGNFRQVLEPGDYRFWRSALPGKHDAIEVVNVLEPRFDHAPIDYLVTQPDFVDHVDVVELGDRERALVKVDGRLTEMLGPGRYVYWSALRTVEIERSSTDSLRFEHEDLATIAELPGTAKFLTAVNVERHERTLLFLNGALVEALDAGLSLFWSGSGRLTWKSVDLRLQSMDVGGQDIMTLDKVTLRVNLVVTHRVTDRSERGRSMPCSPTRPRSGSDCSLRCVIASASSVSRSSRSVCETSSCPVR